ncbi:hypothetical protein [Parachitinimonas caeni]|uniref:Uncharacterized protein n=1 Tax=Parachitinimonas caeni TaxID=3031301 RepID=A0ABT7DU11_9NEIS|nr:hypothetical protein [Parachitinimonas caeni]MDK2123521.1 hypothetical protein [Parachitinimonas caeni]
MSRIINSFDRNGNPRLSTDQYYFGLVQASYGRLSVRHGLPFGGTGAAAILGPDLKLSGASQVNSPIATHQLWSAGFSAIGNGRPNCGFRSDPNNLSWIRGHLINGSWGGPGHDWCNLTPLTSVANSNHKLIESFINAYLEACLRYEQADYRDRWYGVYYMVTCSRDPFADNAIDNRGELYAYAPAYIKVSWRAIEILKPVGMPISGALMNSLPFNSVLHFPNQFGVPVLPAAVLAAGVLPIPGNVPGTSQLLFAPPANFPPRQINGFDGDIEIHQS